MYVFVYVGGKCQYFSVIFLPLSFYTHLTTILLFTENEIFLTLTGIFALYLSCLILYYLSNFRLFSTEQQDIKTRNVTVPIQHHTTNATPTTSHEVFTFAPSSETKAGTSLSPASSTWFVDSTTIRRYNGKVK